MVSIDRTHNSFY